LEKENNFIIITETVEQQIKRKNIQLSYSLCWNKKATKEQTEKIKKIQKNQDIYIYDVTYNIKKQQKEEEQIKDHINKTGKNPLIGKQQKFIDITRLYAKQKKATITTCLGARYQEEKRRNNSPSTEIGLIAIWCKSKKPQNKIYGTLINILE
jgi:hypothetical protein